jgi:hypothetical protein
MLSSKARRVEIEANPSNVWLQDPIKNLPSDMVVVAINGSLYLPFCGTMLPRMKNRGLIDRRFRGLYQTEFQRGSSGPFTCKARTVARAPEPAFRKAGHDRRLR